MKCVDMQELLALFADGSLHSEKDVEVKQHLAHCSSCREELKALQDALFLVREQAVPPIPPRLHQHIMAGVRKEKKRRNARGHLPWWRLSRPLITAAAVLLIFFAGGNMYLANRYLGMSSAPQFDMLAERLAESDSTTEDDGVKMDGETDSPEGSFGSPLAAPTRSFKSFVYFNGFLVILGGGAWYYCKRFPRGER